jgi:hypothetical protein
VQYLAAHPAPFRCLSVVRGIDWQAPNRTSAILPRPREGAPAAQAVTVTVLDLLKKAVDDYSKQKSTAPPTSPKKDKR